MIKRFGRVSITRRNNLKVARRYFKPVFTALLICIPATSSAYVGPGAGLTMLGALWAVVLAIVFVVGGLLLWPIRTLLRRRKNEARTESARGDESANDLAAKQDSGES